MALETAAKDQGKPFTATDNEIRDAIAKAVPGVVMENPSAGMLVYERASKDTRSRLQKAKDKLRGKKFRDFVGHATRPEFGLTPKTHTKGRGLLKRQMSPEDDLSVRRHYQMPSYNAAAIESGFDSDNNQFVRGVILRPAKLNSFALKMMGQTMRNSKETLDPRAIPIIELAASGEPLVDKYGEHISLKHRDADNVREAFYLLVHQQATDHEFSHQADAANDGWEFDDKDERLGRNEFGFAKGAETIAELMSGIYHYGAVVALESIHLIMIVGMGFNIKYTDDSKVQPKIMSKYARPISFAVTYLKEKDETMAEAVGKHRMNIVSNTDSILVNPNPYYNAHLYASGSRDPFFPGDVPVAPPDLLRGNPPERRREPVTLEQFTRWVQLVNMKNKELKRFLDSPLGKKAESTRSGKRSLAESIVVARRDLQSSVCERNSVYLAQRTTSRMGQWLSSDITTWR